MTPRFCAAIIVLAAALGASATQAQEAPSVARTYVPSLANLMLLVQMRHAKLWFAGYAANWELADFTIHELEEGLEDIAKLYPATKDGPIGDMIEQIAKEPISAVEKAVKARDRNSFVRAYERLTAACNSCHQAANHAFIAIRRPAASPFPNQSFAPARP
jgi:hypothetical protein